MASLKTLRTGKDIVVSVPDQSSIKADLLNAKKVVSKAWNAGRSRYTAYQEELEAWENRLRRIRLVVSFTKNEEAKKDLKILMEQASTYQQRYKKLAVEENTFCDSLHQQYAVIEKAVNRFELMETRLSLNEDLRRIAGGANDVGRFGMEDTDMEAFKNIEKVIQTALALVEIKEQKGIEL